MRDVTTRHNLYIDASRVTSIAGQQHIFKAGYALNRVFNDPLNGYPAGRFDMYWGRSFSRGGMQTSAAGMDTTSGKTGRGITPAPSDEITDCIFRTPGASHPRLTVNAGARLEHEFMPPYQRVVNGREVANPIDFGWGDKIAPRLGAAWDVTGSGPLETQRQLRHFL